MGDTFKQMAEEMAASKYNAYGYTAQEIWAKQDSLADFFMLYDRFKDARSVEEVESMRIGRWENESQA